MIFRDKDLVPMEVTYVPGHWGPGTDIEIQGWHYKIGRIEGNTIWAWFMWGLVPATVGQSLETDTVQIPLTGTDPA